MTHVRTARALGLWLLAALAVAIIGAIVLTRPASAVTDTVSVSPSVPSVPVSTKFTAVITVANAEPLQGAETDFTFDQTKLQIVSVTQKGDFTGAALLMGVFPQTAAQAIAEANTTGTLKNITLSWNPGGGSLAIGTHAFVTISLTGTACGDSPLGVGGPNLDFLDTSSIDHLPATANSSVTIKCLPTPTATVPATATSTPQATPTPQPTPTVGPAGGTVMVSGSVPAGSLAITVPTEKIRIPLERGHHNSTSLSVMVTSDTVWQLNVTDPKPTRTGHMTTSDAIPKVLTKSMHAVNGATDVDLAFGGMLSSGSGDSKLNPQLRQDVVPADLPGAYFINVVFQAVAGF